MSASAAAHSSRASVSGQRRPALPRRAPGARPSQRRQPIVTFAEGACSEGGQTSWRQPVLAGAPARLERRNGLSDNIQREFRPLSRELEKFFAIRARPKRRKEACKPHSSSGRDGRIGRRFDRSTLMFGRGGGPQWDQSAPYSALRCGV
jgi:hypothetical protein